MQVLDTSNALYYSLISVCWMSIMSYTNYSAREWRIKLVSFVHLLAVMESSSSKESLPSMIAYFLHMFI